MKATLNDITVARDGSGRLIPQEGTLPDVLDENGEPMTGKAIPMVYGDVMENFGDSDGMGDIETEDVAAIFDRHVVEPNLREHPECPDDGVTAEFVNENMLPMVVRSLLMLVFDVSGMTAEVEMNDDNSASVELDKGN